MQVIGNRFYISRRPIPSQIILPLIVPTENEQTAHS